MTRRGARCAWRSGGTDGGVEGSSGSTQLASDSPDDAEEFCKWIGGRLPTEAEWEYAARGGKANEIVPLNAENARDKANFSGKQGNDRFDVVAPVKQFDPNGYGLFDMSGNLY